MKVTQTLEPIAKKAGGHLLLFTCAKTSEKSMKPENPPRNRHEERCPLVISSSHFCEYILNLLFL